MAELVLGFGTSHSPIVNVSPDWWARLADLDAQDSRIPFAQLKTERADWISAQMEPEKAWARHHANLRALAELADTLVEVAPDVIVLVGDDQRELLEDDNYPAIAIYWGEEIPVVAARQSVFSGHPVLAPITAISYYPEESTSYAGHPELGRYLVESLTAQEFDVGHMRRPPLGHARSGVGHAWSFVWKHLMTRHRAPMVPVLLNTCYAPNRPTVKRCYKLGQAISEAIRTWDSNARVAIGASGGLSHTIVEEDLDQALINAMQRRDVAGLTSIPEHRFDWEGTSESKNWIVVAGACEQLHMRVIDYQPCYRSLAGTGVGTCFATWQ